jgi:Mor family transcriptional regulator
MGTGDDSTPNSTPKSTLLISTKDFFEEIVNDAFEKRNFKTFPRVKSYIVQLLEFYVPAANLFDEFDSSGRRTQKTLAETLLKAQSADALERVELLKKLGDRSLYISGFFGDSLQRKLVDVDYYADMGGMAYGALADCVREDTSAKVYREIGQRFLDYADVLTYVSSRARLHNEENILRLFEMYSKTGSETAREKLLEKGLIPAEQRPLTNSLKKPQ